MHEVPGDFFKELLALHNDQSSPVKIDMESLAKILAGSYFLEEDDLHKGNFGFYVAQDDKGNPQFRFFKIDHDLMFANKIVSYLHSRPPNITYNKNSFKIIPEDLDNFPVLKHSGNHYWPTKKVLIAKGKKAYTNPDEIKAFSDLKDCEDFENAKWQSFLDILLTDIDSKLFNVEDLPSADEFSPLVARSHYERKQELTAALLASPKFKEFLNRNEDQKLALENKLDFKLDDILDDTSPLVIALKLGVYQPLSKTYTRAEIKNSKTVPMEVLFSKLKKQEDQEKRAEIFTAILDLHQRGAEIPNGEKHHLANMLRNKTSLMNMLESPAIRNDPALWEAIIHVNPEPSLLKKIQELILIQESHKQETVAVKNFKSKYLNESVESDHLITQLNEINHESTLSLKAAKNLAQAKVYFAKFKDPGELKKFKEALDNKDPRLKFIQQLRSRLWLIRKFKGLYGQTATCTQMKKSVEAKHISSNTSKFKEQLRGLKGKLTPTIGGKAPRNP